MKKSLLTSLILIVSICFIIFISCDKDEQNNHTEPVPAGFIKGQVFAENGTTAIPLANVFIDYQGHIIMTQTASDGSFTIVAPEGDHILHIQTGNGNIFRTHLNVSVVRNKTTTPETADLKLQQVANLAYISGSYDRIEDIIESLGYEATQINSSDLENLSLIEEYAAIFVNCGTNNYNETIWNNMEEYVSNGGCLYISDWAVNLLIGQPAKSESTINRHAFVNPKSNKTDCPARTGGFISTDQLCTQKLGPAMTINNASVVNQELIDWLEKDSIDVEYDLGSWEVIQVLGDMWEVLIYDYSNEGYGPLAVRTTFENSNKIMQKNNNDGWITICHYPPGNPDNPQTITISVSAWPAHEAHGDHIGPCEGSGGTIIYTSFHNHPGENICPDIEKILEYFIINL